VTIIEPGPALAEQCRSRGLQVVQAFLSDVSETDLPRGPRTFTSFELMEHLHDPGDFLRDVHGVMGPSDLLFFTTLSSHGIDVRSLWERSRSVAPPHHINLLNPRSMSHLCETVGFEVLSATTPGRLDVDIMDVQRDDIDSRFLRSLLQFASEAEKSAVQDLFASLGWSSHMEFVVRRAL
jgi:hypothetical protein